MPRLTTRVPNYSLHKSSGQAVIRLNGRDLARPREAGAGAHHGDPHGLEALDRILRRDGLDHAPHVVVHPDRLDGDPDCVEVAFFSNELFPERAGQFIKPVIESVKVVRRGRVRRAKLYYLRSLRGKAARIRERRDARPTK